MNLKNTLAVAVIAACGCLGASQRIASAAGPELNTLSSQEKRAGWQLLFDGKTTKGWRNYKKDAVSDGWEIKDGVLSRVGKGAGDIITTEQFDSFEISLEYRISKAGNSGLMFHVTEEERAPYMTGPEIQIQDNVDGHDPQKAGWLYQLYPAKDDATKPAGEWNELHVRITPDQCEINMNGFRYSRFVKGSKDWNNKVAASKFAKWEKFGKANKGHICLQDHGNLVSFRNIKLRKLPVGASLPDVANKELPFQAAVAFDGMKWDGWNGIDEDGKVQALRPIVLTHANDNSGRVFVATQRGVLHVFKPGDAKTETFLDIRDRVAYNDKQNEEGLLDVAFHPNFAKTGEVFIYYTSREEPQLSVISKFRVSADNPNRALPGSEVEIMRIKQPFWNHNGATLAFGPDGMLYISLGDGGSGNDPLGNGQNLGTLLGSILRIDINKHDAGKAYAIPKDNPFVGKADARGEIWSYGWRNPWRMSFDRKTGKLWVADVGQNLWEEININQKGGNFGWAVREAAHTFGPKGRDASADLIDPIFEYDHGVGKSITGGFVYRGKKHPELKGAYVFADYITGKLWALRYDAKQKKVTEVGSITSNKLPVLSFGEDQDGEIYFLISTLNGQGVFTLEKK